jgi:hypothetical protein
MIIGITCLDDAHLHAAAKYICDSAAKTKDFDVAVVCGKNYIGACKD